VTEITGKADFSTADDDYAAWLESYEGGLRDDVRDRPEIGLLARAGITVKKLAMIYAMSVHHDSLVITKDDLQRAIETWQLAEARLGELFDEMAWTSAQQQVQAVRRLVRGEQEISRSLLLRRSHLLARELDGVLATLIQRHEVDEFVIGQGREQMRIYSWRQSAKAGKQ